MALDEETRRRFARHLLLAEVGERGQARLLAHATRIDGDPRAVEAARMYLERAGVSVDADASDVSAAEVRPLPERPELDEAAAFLSGALAAVESIKRALDVGHPAALPDHLRLEPKDSDRR